MLLVLLGCSVCPSGTSKRVLEGPFAGVHHSVEAVGGDVCDAYPDVEVAMKGTEDEAVVHWTAYFTERGFQVEERRISEGPRFGSTRQVLLTHPDGHLVAVDTTTHDGTTMVQLPDLSDYWRTPVPPGADERVEALRARARGIAAGLAVTHVDICSGGLGTAAPWWTNEHLEQRTRPGPDDLVPLPRSPSRCITGDLLGTRPAAEADGCAREAADWQPVFVEDPNRYRMPMVDPTFVPTGEVFTPDGVFTPGERGGLLLAFVGTRAVCGVAVTAQSSDEVRVDQAGVGLAEDLGRQLTRAITQAVADLE